MKSLTLLFAALVLMIGSAFAQDKVELNGSYQFTSIYSNGQTNTSNPGWNASALVHFKNSGLGIVTDWSGTDFGPGFLNRKALNTGAGGLQYTFNRSGRVRPYLNALVGDAKITGASSTNAFSQQLGAGVDLGLTKRFAVRAGLQYLHADGPLGIQTVSPITGVTFRF